MLFGKDVETVDLAGTQGVKEIWTNLIPGNTYLLRVLGARQPDGASVTVRDLFTTSDRSRRCRLLAKTIARPLQRSRTLLCSRGPRDGQTDLSGRNGRLCVYGVSIGPRLMITNQHCMENPSVCPSVVVQFDLDKGQVVPVEKQRRCAVAKAIDYDLDFAVFELDRAPDAAIKPLRFAAASPAADTALIPGRTPRGRRPSRLRASTARRLQILSRVAQRQAADFTHSCDTLGGSSGSGLLDSQLMVAGLHHFGIGGDEPTYNRAVRVEPIVAKLRDLQLIAAGGNPRSRNAVARLEYRIGAVHVRNARKRTTGRTRYLHHFLKARVRADPISDRDRLALVRAIELLAIPPQVRCSANPSNAAYDFHVIQSDDFGYAIWDVNALAEGAR